MRQNGRSQRDECVIGNLSAVNSTNSGLEWAVGEHEARCRTEPIHEARASFTGQCGSREEHARLPSADP
jgi:hypothetical protein